VAALQLLAVLVERGGAASTVTRVFQPLPQRLKSVRFAGASPLHEAGVRGAIAAAEQTLNGTGRLLIRASGTEPVIRVMAEAEDADLVDELVEQLCARIAEVAEQESEGK
jgi:phosphoglucosamine mutase